MNKSMNERNINYLNQELRSFNHNDNPLLLKHNNKFILKENNSINITKNRTNNYTSKNKNNTNDRNTKEKSNESSINLSRKYFETKDILNINLILKMKYLKY